MVSAEFLITSLILVLLPGTGVIYTLSIGLFHGARASVAAALGCTLGIVPSMVASILGLSVILHASLLAFEIVKFIGVAYLLYLAWCMWKERGKLSLENGVEQKNTSLVRVCVKACLINVLNPKLTIFFLAFLPQFVPVNTDSVMNQMLLLGGIFMVMTLIVFIFYGLLASKVRQYIVGASRVVKLLQGVFSASFALLAVKLAFTNR